jgi:hypothetical protein
MIRASALAMILLFPSLTLAHHGGGTFDNTRTIELTGTLTRLELINPHSWIYFEVTGKDGKVSQHLCEMRAATVLRRSGWREEMFRPGQTITIEGQPDRIDPNSCYLNTIVLQDGTRADRYGQFTKPGAKPASTRALRRPTGEPKVLQYGQLGFTRTVHMNLKAHPAGVKPTRAGHSIGRWENDVLVVDTVGFAPGVSPPLLNSDKLHVVERFTLDTARMELTRAYTAEDPVYFTGQYAGSDVLQVADLPNNPDKCSEQGFVDYSKQAR